VRVAVNGGKLTVRNFLLCGSTLNNASIRAIVRPCGATIYTGGSMAWHAS
jgi:hypothetical protein